jgi:hypothetical protein
MTEVEPKGCIIHESMRKLEKGGSREEDRMRIKVWFAESLQ